MSQITRGRLRASQPRARGLGVWVHVEVEDLERRAGVARVGVSGGDVARAEAESSSKDNAALAVRVVCFVGEGLGGVSAGAGSKSRGWFRVATMVMESPVMCDRNDGVLGSHRCDVRRQHRLSQRSVVLLGER